MATSDLIWMVRAGKGSEFVEQFLEQGLAAYGDKPLPGVTAESARAEIEAAYKSELPTLRPGTITSWAAQQYRFATEISVGDAVVTYDNSSRLYYLGTVTSDARAPVADWTLVREVDWQHKVARDSLQPASLNSLGSISTLFQPRAEAAADLRRNAVALDAETGVIASSPVQDATEADSESSEAHLFDEVVSKAQEFIEDRIAKLSPDEMEELVAELLRAMGYRARVSPKGADRGVDVIASPDGLMLEEPRIFVEVKHRPGTAISSDQVRSFLGGRQPGDRCLYVSTGGFTKDARYEAERSSVPLTLLTLPDLRKLLLENYDRFSPAGTSLVPLEQIYWPIVQDS